MDIFHAAEILLGETAGHHESCEQHSKAVTRDFLDHFGSVERNRRVSTEFGLEVEPCFDTSIRQFYRLTIDFRPVNLHLSAGLRRVYAARYTGIKKSQAEVVRRTPLSL